MTDRGRLDSLLGPSAGLAVSAMKLGAGLTDDLSRGHLSRGTFRAARQFLPGQNAVPLQQTINWGEANLEHAFDWQPLK